MHKGYDYEQDCIEFMAKNGNVKFVGHDFMISEEHVARSILNWRKRFEGEKK